MSEHRILRSLLIIEALANATKPLGLTALLELTEIPKTTLIRHLDALCNAGFIVRLPNQLGYTATSRSLVLGLKVLRSTVFINAAHSVLRKLVQAINESCNLTILFQDTVHYLAREEINLPWSLQLHVRPNATVPLHCTASGKLFLANLPLIQQKAYLNSLDLKAYTSETITDLSALKKELEITKQRGFGIDNEEFVTGMVAIAVPIYSTEDNETVIAAIACHSVAARTNLEQLLAHKNVMEKAAKKIGSLLSHNKLINPDN